MTVVFFFLAIIVGLLAVAAFVDVGENEPSPQEETPAPVAEEPVVDDAQAAPVYFATFTHLVRVVA